MIGRALQRIPLRARLLPTSVFHGQNNAAFCLPVAALSLRFYSTPGRPKKVVGEPSRPVKRAVKRAAAKPNTGDSAAEELVNSRKRTAARKQKAAKKTLSPEEKAAKEEKAALQKQRAKASAEKRNLADLRKQALEPPKIVLANAYNHFSREQWKDVSMPESNDRAGRNQVFARVTKSASESWKNLSAAEIEHYNHLATQASEASRADYKRWVASHSVEEIQAANLARSHLRKREKKSKPKSKSKWPPIHDERAVKRPLNAFVQFAANRHASGDFRHIALTERAKLIGAEWKALSEDEKKKYLNLQGSERDRFVSEYTDTYGYPPRETPRPQPVATAA